MITAYSILDFGRYNGRSVEAIWTGVNPFDETEVVRKYIYNLCSFLLNQDNINEVPCSKFNIDPNCNEIRFFAQNHFPVSIIIDNDTINVSSENQLIDFALFKILSEILKETFKIIPNYYSKPSYTKCIGHSINSIKFQLLQADPTYIVWCIKNIESFYFYPNELVEFNAKKCSYLSHFDLSNSSKNKIYYKPYFEKRKFTLSHKTIEINKKKYEDNFGGINTLYDINPEYYQSNISNQLCAACHQTSCICNDKERIIIVN